MLTSLVLRLAPTETLNMPRHLGRATHSLFMSLLASHDAALAQSVHDSAGWKPFTSSNVMGARRQGQSLLATSADELRVRFTGLNAPVSAVLQKIAGEAGNTLVQVELDRVPLRVIGATLDGDVDPLAGQTTYEALAMPYLFSRETPATRITLRFLSPTAIQARGQNLPFPLPGSVFGGLAARWNAFSTTQALPEEVKRFSEECIAVSRFMGRSRVWPGKDGATLIGFVGGVRYAATNRDRYWLSLLNVLADYAWYAGVGYQTTQGMGQVRRVSDDWTESRSPSAGAAIASGNPPEKPASAAGSRPQS